MSNLTPSNPITGASTSGGGGGADQNYQSTPARIVNLPSPLQNLQQNVLLGARLVGANADGSVILRTAQGDMTLNVPVGIPPNAQLQVQLQAGTPPTATLILTGGDPAQTGKVQAPSTPGITVPSLNVPTSSVTTTLSTAASTPPPDLKLNVVVRALVMEAFQALAAVPNSSALNAIVNKPEVLANMLEQLAAKVGTPQSAQADLISQLGVPGKLPTQIGQLSIPAKLLETVQQTILLLQQQPDGIKGLSNDQRALLQLLQAGQAAAAPATPAAPQMTSQLLPGTELNLKLVQIIPPAPGTTTPTPVTILPSLTGSLTVAGQVTPQLVNGQPVVQTEQGSILLQATNKFPVGTTLVFELVQNAVRANPAMLPTVVEAAKSSGTLPKLEQAMLLMSQVNDDAFRALMNTMPKLNGQLPVTALFFFQALRTGEVRNWLGDKSLQVLRRSGTEGAELVKELTEEFEKVSTKSKSALPGEWRQITIPYQGEQGLSAMRFAVRDHYQQVTEDGGRGDAQHENPSRVTRFLFDIEFSELGPLQVDGLMRPGADQNKQLDIVLRTQELLPSDMRRELREIFSESLDTYGMRGGLSFQAGYQNWIRLAEERNKGAQI